MDRKKSFELPNQTANHSEREALHTYEAELATYALAKVIEGEDKNPQLRHILATNQEIVTD